MELMSLLLYAIVSALPQGLGMIGSSPGSVIVKRNAEINMHKRLLLNAKVPPLLTNSAKNDAFEDRECNKCITCMEKAVELFKRARMIAAKPSLLEMYNDIYRTGNPRKVKRSIETNSAVNKTLSSLQKMVVITKYLDDYGKTYAVKVKESDRYPNNTSSYLKSFRCNVYQVKHTFPCDASEITVVTKKKTKRNKKLKKNSTTTSEPAIVATTNTTPREAEQVPESYMLSTEDIYS